MSPLLSRCRVPAKMEATSEISWRAPPELYGGTLRFVKPNCHEHHRDTTQTLLTRPKRADARRNYEKVLAAAREAFAEGGESTALEEIARRAGVGIGTLYRHFPNRQALLEALYVERGRGGLPLGGRAARRAPTRGRRSTSWFERFIGYIATKQALAAELLNYLDRDAPLFQACRAALCEAGEPLLTRAQEAGVVRPDVEIAEVIQMVDAGSPRSRPATRADRAHPPDRARRPALPPRLGQRHRLAPESVVRLRVGPPCQSRHRTVASSWSSPPEASTTAWTAAARLRADAGPRRRRSRHDVDAGGVALEHAVGEEDQAVAGLQRQRLHPVLVLAARSRTAGRPAARRGSTRPSRSRIGGG